MLSLESLIPFIMASMAITLLPGPDNIFVLSLSTLQGSKAGLATAMGMALGNFVHILAVALGLGALIARHPSILSSIKIFGVAYLLYLAWQSWRHPLMPGKPDNTVDASNNFTHFALFRRGIFMNLLNPKVILFFLAFFPQFIDSNHPHQFMQILVLGCLFVAQTMIIFGSIALVAGRIQSFTNPLSPRLIAGATSAIFLLLCFYIVFGEMLFGRS